MTISKQKKYQALRFAATLSEFATKAPDPDIKAMIYKAVNATRATYGYDYWQKLEEVEGTVRLGASTIRDLCRETPFPRQEIEQILRELVAASRLRETSVRTGPKGPKVKCFFPKTP